MQLTNAGVNGQTVVGASTGAPLAAVVAAVSTNTPTVVVCNWGANDLPSRTESDFKTAYLTVIDAIHAKNASATIWLMTPWRRGYETEVNTMAGWIADIIASRSTFVFAGPDERVWLKGADDGATMSSDGIHYSTAGQAECARQWKLKF